MRGREVDRDGIKNAQKNMAAKYQKIQQKIEAASDEVGKMNFIGRAYDNNITTKFTGEKKAVDIDINKEATLKKMVVNGILKESDLKSEETRNALYALMDNLPDILIGSINEAIDKVDKATDEKISEITKGMHIEGIN